MNLIYPDGAVIMAPVAGHTDLAMRRAIRSCGCHYAFTEMIDAGSLVFANVKTSSLAVRGSDEPFLGIQLVGSDLDTLAKAADIVNSMNFDVLDFNLGCPAPKVAKKGEGITLALKRPDDAVRAVECLVKKSRIPVTVKTRIQSETDPGLTVNFCKRLQEAGAQALTLHGRVMKVFYSGPVFFDIIKAVKESLDIPVIANGGAMTPALYRELIEKSTCTRGMIARGALGNPWIFRGILQPDSKPPAVSEFAAHIEQYMRDMVEVYGPEQSYIVARKTILFYLKGRGYPGTLRASVSYLTGPNTFSKLMEGIRQGPSPRYWEFLREHPEEVERQLSPG